VGMLTCCSQVPTIWAEGQSGDDALVTNEHANGGTALNIP
jgi:hypothetical protein